MRGVVACLGLFLLAPVALAAPAEIRLGNIAPEGSAYDKGCAGALRTELARDPAVAAKVRLKVFMGAVLGDEATMLRHTQDGKLMQVVALTTLSHANVVPELGLFALPFLFHDDAEVDAVMTAEPVRQRIRELVGKHDLLLVGIAEAGWRNFVSRDKAIRAPADVAGLRVRSQPAALQLEMWRALGASPRALGITELPSVLEHAQIDAFDMQANFLFAASLHAHARHITLSHHVYQSAVLVASRTGLAPAAAKLLVEAWTRAERSCIEAIRAENRTVDAELPKAGLEVVHLSPEAHRAFETQLAPLRQRFRKGTTAAGRALLDSVERVLARHRAAR